MNLILLIALTVTIRLAPPIRWGRKNTRAVMVADYSVSSSLIEEASRMESIRASSGSGEGAVARGILEVGEGVALGDSKDGGSGMGDSTRSEDMKSENSCAVLKDVVCALAAGSPCHSSM